MADAADLHAKNCASGSGDGPAAALAASPPAVFTLATLYNRPSAVLYAKIRCGGMGTGMSLVDYLWSLAVKTSDQRSA